jgi:hypothetical protein
VNKARTSSNICSYNPSKKIRGATGLPSGWHSDAMLDSSQGSKPNQINICSYPIFCLSFASLAKLSKQVNIYSYQNILLSQY